ncbi:MAG: hypothetical protein ACOYMN_12560 [Roseimicrobium sp.]
MELLHEPTGTRAQAGERRSAEENRQAAIIRLRLRLARGRRGPRNFLQCETVKKPIAALEGEVTDFDELQAIRSRREIDDATRAVHHEVASLRIGEDHHRRCPRINAHRRAVHRHAFSFGALERVKIHRALGHRRIADGAHWQGHGGLGGVVGFAARDLRQPAYRERSCGRDPEPRKHPRIVNADRCVRRDGHCERALQRLACARRHLFRGDFGRGELELRHVLNVLPRDADLDRRARLPAHGHQRE